jgi:hypothetical protein
MGADLKVYFDALRTLEQHAATTSYEGTRAFQNAYDRALRIRLAYEVAREKFNEHIASHGCDSADIAA